MYLLHMQVQDKRMFEQVKVKLHHSTNYLDIVIISVPGIDATFINLLLHIFSPKTYQKVLRLSLISVILRI